MPKHLQGMLAGGVLGAGVGYGLGYLGEQLLPEDWHKGRLRKTLGAAGAALGAAPGVARMGINVASGHGMLDDVLSTAYPDDAKNYLPQLPDGAVQAEYAFVPTQVKPTGRHALGTVVEWVNDITQRHE